ncbi:hypothetical protein CI610_03191 [invertebrate metagenome]|uniref:Uncharacterized protein n=1 Tax=invertebrate metagenome TaxID=1711999 RepID=A0A2H9T3R9_9ZZZZ
MRATCMRVLSAYVCFGRLRYVRVKSPCDRPELLPIYSATSLKHTAEDTQQHTPPGHIILTTGEPVVPLLVC